MDGISSVSFLGGGAGILTFTGRMSNAVNRPGVVVPRKHVPAF